MEKVGLWFYLEYICMWYKEAQLGVMNLEKRLFKGAEQAIIDWVKNEVLLDGDLPNVPSEFRDKYIWNDLEVPFWLKGVVKGIDHNVSAGRGAVFNTDTKILSVPRIIDKKRLSIFSDRILHEIRHAVDPRFNNPKYIEKYTKLNQPQIIYRNILDNFMKTKEIISSYDQYIIHLYMKHNNPIEAMKDPSKFLNTINSIKNIISESDFIKAQKAFLSGHDLYVDNPLEHPNQMGDVRGLLNKKYLDLVRKKYYSKLDDIGWRNYLKKTLIDTNSVNFEKLSQQIQDVSNNDGLSISYIVKNSKDKKWQQKYLSQVARAINQYEIENPLSTLVKKENRINQNNPDAAKNLNKFLSNANELEKLTESNPAAWKKFINNPIFSKMINNKVLGMFKNLGTESKSLSQSLKGLNMNSPYWALLEPALEFGLYQFGLYLENPSAYKINSQEQSTIIYLKKMIEEIKADNKISNKKGYFIKNYGSTLKTIGSIEQREILDGFNMMSFNNFMNIGKNTGQK